MGATIGSNMRASNDNSDQRRNRVCPSFTVGEGVSTRRQLKLRNTSLNAGSAGRVVVVRVSGRLYDVAFLSPNAIVVTLSHCDIAAETSRLA